MTEVDPSLTVTPTGAASGVPVYDIMKFNMPSTFKLYSYTSMHIDADSLCVHSLCCTHPLLQPSPQILQTGVVR